MFKGVAMAYVSVLAAVMFVVFLVVPMPSDVIDLVLVLMMGLSVILYMRSTTINEWHEMKTFPTIILLLGIFRISINISTTRNILSDGESGHVIEQFGNFVVGGNVLVGLVIFIILIIFQFIVANGSSRTAEVAARFTLDAMPNKYMSIDADLQQKLITESVAQERRKMLAMESDFYGNMDGAGKFIKGDVIMGIAVTLINIIFGLIIGIVQKGMSIGEAAYHFTLLTVGDGVVNQISSLLVAVASGIVMTRVYDGSGKNLPQGIYTELMKNEIVAYSVGIMFIAMGLFTQLPFLPFAMIGVAVIYLGFKHQRKVAAEKMAELEKEKEQLLLESEEQMQVVDDRFGVRPADMGILVLVGRDLIPLLIREGEEEAKNKVEFMRRRIANEIGLSVPYVNFKEDMSLKPNGKYVIKIKGAKVAEGIIKTGHLFALKGSHTYTELEAEPGQDPIFGQDGYWIEESMAHEAEMENYQVLEPLGIIVTHLDRAIRSNLHDLMQRQQIKELIDTLENENPILIEEIKKKNVELSLIQSVLQRLVKESVSIQDLPTIIEGIIDGNGIYKNDVDNVVSLVRERISNHICEKMKSRDGKIHVILMDQRIEGTVKTAMDAHNGYFLEWDASVETAFVEKLGHAIRKARISDVKPVILVSRRNVRAALVKHLVRYGIDVPVLCTDELVPGILLEQIATV